MGTKQLGSKEPNFRVKKSLGNGFVCKSEMFKWFINLFSNSKLHIVWKWNSKISRSMAHFQNSGAIIQSTGKMKAIVSTRIDDDKNLSQWL